MALRNEPQCPVYLDYNATTPLDPEVLLAITHSLKEDWGNPSSGYPAGQDAKKTITSSRIQVASMIGALPSDIIFNSGGTEANYTVFHSIAKHWSSRKGKPHVILSSIEHCSVTLSLKRMEEEGTIEMTEVVPTHGTGRVSVGNILAAVRDNTALVSVMLANNETGVLQPVAEICSALRKLEKDTGREERIFVHTDAAQAIGKVPVDITALGVDYLTIVGHKFYGPRIGALFVRGLEQQSTPYYCLFVGGGQERGYRHGTENTGMIAGLGKAAELVATNIHTYQADMQHVKNYLEQRLKEVFRDNVHFNANFPGTSCLPNTCNISVALPGTGCIVQGNNVLNRLKKCVASSAAACSSHLDKPSQILLDSGVPVDIARGAMRISVGRTSTRGDIDVFVSDLEQAIAELV